MDDFDDFDNDDMDETTSATSGVGGGDTTGDEADEIDEEISQDDAWVVISAFFDEKVMHIHTGSQFSHPLRLTHAFLCNILRATQGLVRQQLDSFDSFLEVGLQECVDDAGDIVVTSEPQFGPGSDANAMLKRYKISFGQVSLSTSYICMTERGG